MERTADLAPTVVAVEPGSAADAAGVRAGDVITAVQGVVPRDILEWHRLVDDDEVELSLVRDGSPVELTVPKVPGRSFGVTISSAVFDRVQTCDNHCEFCFIYQLPKGLRRSLYTKDDDYRLSFLFGNFTTLTRFTEADLERVVDERLSPLYVSVHAVDPDVRASMLRNERGGTSLRWLRQMLDHGIEAVLQVVLCPGVNDGRVLESTLLGILEQFPEVNGVAVVPLGLSRHNTEDRMRVHDRSGAREAVATVERWAGRFNDMLGRVVVHAADELYLRAGLDVPEAAVYGSYDMLEDGVGLVRSFVEAFEGRRDDTSGHGGGFFASVDPVPYVRPMNPAVDTGLRPMHGVVDPVHVAMPRRSGRTGRQRLRIVTGELAAPVLEGLLEPWAPRGVEVVAAQNRFFGGNTAVAGLLTFTDILDVLGADDTVHLLPSTCLNGDRFLDGHTLDELAQRATVEVVPASGTVLRRTIEAFVGGVR